MRLGDLTRRIRRSASGQSCASPPVKRMARRRPLASASAWIFVLRPPRERPIACFCSPVAIGLFRSQAALQAEILVLRHQLNVLRRMSPERVALTNIDRLVFVGLHSLVPKVLDALKILKPE